MSADDGIYILQSKDGFRVIYASAIENIYKTERHEFNPKYLKKYFGDASILDSRDEAWEEARLIYSELTNKGGMYLEYGITIIPGHEDQDFPV